VHSADDQDLVFFFDVTAHVSSIDLARIQRAGKGAEHSTAQSGDDVVDRGCVRLAET